MKSKLFLLFALPFLLFGNWETQNENEALFLNRIADFWEEGEYSIAKTQIQEFLSQYPESAYTDSLNAALGDLFLREKNASFALESYAKIEDPEISARVFINKLECLLEVQWFSSLVDECEAYLKNNPASDVSQTVTHYLAKALYELSLNSEGEKRIAFAEKAKPHFENLMGTNLKNEITQSYAHLLTVLKEYEKAANLYFDLAKEGSSEHLFKAALLQAEYDKELALRTLESFLEISQSPEAHFSRLSLLFDLELYEKITESRDFFLNNVSSSNFSLAHLLIGRSFFQLERYEEACLELGSFIASQEAANPSLYSALLMLIKASEKAGDLPLFSIGLNKLELLYPGDESLIQAKLSKALLLKKQNRTEEALRELSRIEERPEVLLEEISIYDKMGSWRKTRELAFTFLSKYPNHAMTSLAGKYLIAASTEIANSNEEGKKVLIDDLKNLLKKQFIPDETKLFWQYLLGKTYFILNELKPAKELLETATKNTSFPEEVIGDAYLILGLCYKNDLDSFISYLEKSLQSKDVDKGFIHSSLYNAYLKKDVEKAELHLFEAFKANAKIEEKNLLWLSSKLIDKERPLDAIDVLKHISGELAQKELARAHFSMQEYNETIALLKPLEKDPKTTLLLGKAYARIGNKKGAKELLDSLYLEISFLRTFCGAAAYLESARLDYADGEKPSIETLAKLKNLILQKTISNEPTYFEASLDYITLQTQRPQDEEREEVEALLRKKLSLLEKAKKEFEREDDLLSKDYHAGRKSSSLLNAIYTGYMDFIDAEIFTTKSLLEKDSLEQRQLQAKAKDLFQKIVDEKVHPDLVARANQCLSP